MHPISVKPDQPILKSNAIGSIIRVSGKGQKKKIINRLESLLISGPTLYASMRVSTLVVEGLKYLCFQMVGNNFFEASV